MNVNIYLEDDLYKRLSSVSKKGHISRNMIIRNAISEWLNRHESEEWPKTFFKFEGQPDFPSADELRKNLIKPKEDPLL